MNEVNIIHYVMFVLFLIVFFFFFKQKTAYEMRISDWSSDVCSSDLVFLMNARTTIISLTAIPISACAAILVLDAMGQSINTMTLGGLAIAIGELVDDAVVGVENVFRRLRLNAKLPNPRPVLGVVADASMEVRSGILIDRKSTRLNSSH